MFYLYLIGGIFILVAFILAYLDMIYIFEPETDDDGKKITPPSLFDKNDNDNDNDDNDFCETGYTEINGNCYEDCPYGMTPYDEDKTKCVHSSTVGLDPSSIPRKKFPPFIYADKECPNDYFSTRSTDPLCYKCPRGYKKSYSTRRRQQHPPTCHADCVKYNSRGYSNYEDCQRQLGRRDWHPIKEPLKTQGIHTCPVDEDEEEEEIVERELIVNKCYEKCPEGTIQLKMGGIPRCLPISCPDGYVFDDDQNCQIVTQDRVKFVNPVDLVEEEEN